VRAGNSWQPFPIIAIRVNWVAQRPPVKPLSRSCSPVKDSGQNQTIVSSLDVDPFERV